MQKKILKEREFYLVQGSGNIAKGGKYTHPLSRQERSKGCKEENARGTRASSCIGNLYRAQGAQEGSSLVTVEMPVENR